ncbi:MULTISPECIES: hypothetical protein [unclassified Stenotrophomonas]|uniref:hypothetical protein n=1 Tax=unclassified Stenotrophomonas TaxID=196198 RepID=UPI003012D793
MAQGTRSDDDGAGERLWVEVASSVADHLRERAANPLTGAIATFAIIWNYKLFLVLLSFEPVRIKLSIIGSLYGSGLSSVLAVMVPIVLGGAYVFIYSTPAALAANHVERHRRMLEDSKRQLDNLKLITRQEAQTLKEQFYESELEFNRRLHMEREQLHAVRDQLRLAVDRSEAAERELQYVRAALDGDLLQSQSVELAELRMKLALAEAKVQELAGGTTDGALPFETSSQKGIRYTLFVLARHPAGLTKAQIGEKTGFAESFVEHIIGELFDGRWIKSLDPDDFTEGWELNYAITRAGTAHALELGWDGT